VQLVEHALSPTRVGDFVEQAEQMVERLQGNLLAVGLPCIDSEILPRRNRAFSISARLLECVAFQTHPFQVQVSSVEQPWRPHRIVGPLGFCYNLLPSPIWPWMVCSLLIFHPSYLGSVHPHVSSIGHADYPWVNFFSTEPSHIAWS
jgi:hypothetical protein